MKNLIRLFILFLVVSANGLLAQDEVEQGFQRLYSADNNLIINLANEALNDGGFYLASTSFSLVGEPNVLNITRHNIKGNQVWSNDYEFVGVTFPIDQKSFSMVVDDDNNIFITAFVFDPAIGKADESLMLRIDELGEVLWSNIVIDNSGGHGVLSFPATTRDVSGNINVFTSQLDNVTYGVSHNIFNNDNERITNQTYVATDTFNNNILNALVDAAVQVDSSHSILTVTDTFAMRSGLFGIDSLGNPNFINEYRVSLDSFPANIFQLYSMSATPDTSSIMAGFILDQFTNNIIGIVAKADREGNILWSKSIDGSVNGLLPQINDVTVNSRNEIIVTGKYLDFTVGGVPGDFAIFFDLDGNVIRQTDFQSVNSFFLDINTGINTLWGQLSNLSDGNTLYSTTGIDINGGLLANTAIKIDSIGNAMCSDTFNIGEIRDFALLTDTLNIVINDFSSIDTTEVTTEVFDGYNTPVLTLSDTTFCPQDPIIFEIVGFVPGATDYIWSTGDTTDRITVMEEGEFSVTVTVGDRICYTLCDTSNISTFNFPEAQIQMNTDFVCEDDFIRLNGFITNGAQPIQSFIWEDGSTESVRDIFEAGNYSLTITDNCGNTSVASQSLSPNDFILGNTVTIGRDITLVCEQGIIGLSANSVTAVRSYVWSTGDTTQAIEVDEAGTYTVSVIDICNEETENSITITDDDLSPPELNVDISQGIFSCENGVPLAVVPDATIETYAWSTGETTATIEANTSGIFMVTVTDICGTTAIVDTEVELSDLSDFVFPNIFFPTSQEQINTSFGPYVECPDLFVANEYNLEIFNRWGNKVYESNRIIDRWNGRIDNMGDIIQEDVYLFVWSYLDENSNEITGNGSVTLSR